MIGCPHYWIFFIIFRIFFTTFFGLFHLNLENCVCFWNIFTFLYFVFVFYIFLRFFIFIHTFSRFSTQVYRFYRNFLVFHFFHHQFSAFLFYATAFLHNFIDYFPESVISDFSWIAAYISGVCSYLFLQHSCVIIFGIEEVVCFQIFLYVIYYFTYIVSVFDTSLYIFLFSVNFPVFLASVFNIFPYCNITILAFLVLLHEFWSWTWIDRFFPLLNFLHNFSILFYNFFGLVYLTLENCVCFWYIFTFLYFFSYIFPFFDTSL